MYPLGFLKVGDMDDLVADLAPRPYMMTNGSGGPIFPTDGVRAIVTKAEKSYALQGAASNYKSIIFPDPTDVEKTLVCPAKRRYIYSW